MRLKPLRGQRFIVDGEEVTFIEIMSNGKARVIHNASVREISPSHLPLPIIDTKDYEKIKDTKYKGD